jgi:hypothetical protein
MRYLLVSFLRKRAGQIDEMVSVTKRVRTSDMNSANVILDFADKKVVKCIIENKEHDTTFEKMRDYYARIYPNLVDQLEREAGIEKGLAKLEAKLSPTKKK